MFMRMIHIAHTIIIAILASIILASNILAFLGAYTPVFVLILSLSLAIILGMAHWHWGRTWRLSFSQSTDHDEPAWFTLSILAVVSIFVLVIFIYRLGIYPLSPIGDVISPDLIGYHGVKAYDLVVTGTLWNLDVIYGQYPIGYESLLALGVVLNIGIEIAGFMQAVCLLWLMLTLILLLRRYTSLPSSLIMILVTTSLFLPEFYSFILIVGKNDLLLSITILSAVLHAPIGWRKDDQAFHPLGLALVTMMSLAVKASGLFVLVALWLMILWQWWQAYRMAGKQSAIHFLHPVMFIVSLGVMFPGGLWVLRNYIMMGSLFSPEISGFFIGSIINNITNPDVYNSGAESSTFIVLMLLQIVMFFVLSLRQQSRQFALILAVMIFAFITAPLGAFHRPERDTLHIEWRYTAHSFMLIAVIVLAIITPLLQRWLRFIWQRDHLLRGVGILFIMGCVGVALTLDVSKINAIHPENTRVLRDVVQYDAAQSGYASVYEYVQREITDAIIGYSFAQPLFLYDAGATNYVYAGKKYPLGLPSAHVERVPDYLVHVDIDRSGDDPFRWQPYFEQFEWREIYRDETGMVWQRVPVDS